MEVTFLVNKIKTGSNVTICSNVAIHQGKWNPLIFIIINDLNKQIDLDIGRNVFYYKLLALKMLVYNV